MVFKAIGQTFVPAPLDGAARDRLEGGRIAVDEERRTSMPGVWAGGDCVAGGEDLTVAAAQDGKLAAEIIHRALTALMMAASAEARGLRADLLTGRSIGCRAQRFGEESLRQDSHLPEPLSEILDSRRGRSV